MSNLIPEGWDIHKINDISKVGSSKRVLQSEYVADGVPFFRSKEVILRSKRKTIKDTLYISRKRFEELKNKFSAPIAGDILVTAVGTIGVIYLVEDLEFYFKDGNLLWVKDINGKVSSEYLAKYMASDFFQASIGRITSGSSQAALTIEKLSELEFNLPPLPEQQKIAKILTSVDDVIEKTQAQIDKLKDLKTGMMQELLTNGIGHTEFKNSPVGRIPAQWEVKPLSALIDVMESGWSPQCESYPAVAGEWGVLKTTSVKWEGFNFRENKKLPEFLEPRLTAQVEHKDILITRAGPAERVGVVAYVDKVPKKIMLSDKIIRLKTKDSCNPKFLSLWLSCDTTKHYVASRISGLAQSQTNISQDILKRCPCVVPPIYEQEVIALTLSSIEKRHNQLTLKLAQLKSAKKALMQDLLTGKVRVKVDSE